MAVNGREQPCRAPGSGARSRPRADYHKLPESRTASRHRATSGTIQETAPRQRDKTASWPRKRGRWKKRTGKCARREHRFPDWVARFTTQLGRGSILTASRKSYRWENSGDSARQTADGSIERRCVLGTVNVLVVRRAESGFGRPLTIPAQVPHDPPSRRARVLDHERPNGQRAKRGNEKVAA
jgi:hypothetical protein